jgi:tRNA threonylcarbamoyladenosine biosynthesis protein TsaE
MATYISRSPAETEAFGERLGRAARPGDVFGLTGPLGAGKTALARGLARGLGFAGRVPSPTFALVHTHAGGRLPWHHLDLYRLETTDEIIAAGLEEFFAPADAVTVVEWFDRWTGPAPAGLHRIHLEPLDGDDRRLTHDQPGA